jgi:predicted lipoprotein with Yx(FWY)xxD motif
MGPGRIPRQRHLQHGTRTTTTKEVTLKNRIALATAATAFAAGSLAAFALAASTTVGSATSSALGARVATSASGRTLYALSGESPHHLLCKSHECLAVWPPLTVSSKSAHLKAGSGVHGHLALIKRSSSSWQVTLNGIPLYRYSGDSGRAEDNGQGIESFGGTWHAVLATGKASTKANAPSPGAAPPMSPAYPGY